MRFLTLSGIREILDVFLWMQHRLVPAGMARAFFFSPDREHFTPRA